MAELRLHDDDGAIDIDLLTGVWRVEHGTVSLPGSDDDALNRLQSGERLQWTWPLVTDAAANPDYGEAAEAINYALEQARLWGSDSLRANTLWLKARPGGQYARRFVVIGGMLVELTSPGADLFVGKRVKRGSLTLFLHVAPPEANDARDVGQLPDFVPAGGGGRHPVVGTYPDADASSDGLALSCLGGVMEVAGRGTRPGRIGVLALAADASVAQKIEQYWVGIKSLYYEAGVASEFEPSWMIDDGTYTYLGDPFSMSAGGAGADAYVRGVITYNSDEFGRCFTVKLSQVYAGSYPEHFIGRFRVLLRVNLSAAVQTIRCRLGYGMATATDGEGLVYSDPVYITTVGAGTYRLIEIGSVTIPPFGYRAGGDVDALLQLDANHLEVAGSAQIDFNRFILIPERRVYLPESTTTITSGDNQTAVYTAPDDKVSALVYNAGTLKGLPSVQPTPDFYMPAEGGLIVVAGAGADNASSNSHTIDLGVRLYDRYTSWRGAG